MTNDNVKLEEHSCYDLNIKWCLLNFTMHGNIASGHLFKRQTALPNARTNDSVKLENSYYDLNIKWTYLCSDILHQSTGFGAKEHCQMPNDRCSCPANDGAKLEHSCYDLNIKWTYHCLDILHQSNCFSTKQDCQMPNDRCSCPANDGAKLKCSCKDLIFWATTSKH